jgi:hypothetical protein
MYTQNLSQLLYMYRTAGIPPSVKQWVTGWVTRVQFSGGVSDFSLPHSAQTNCGFTQSPIQRMLGCYSWGGVRLSPFGISATNWPIIPAMDNRWWVWSSQWNENWQGKLKYSEKTCPSVTFSATNPTLPDLGLDLGHCIGKPVTNLLSCGTAAYRGVLSPRIKRLGCEAG